MSFIKYPVPTVVPQYVTEELLRAEGFTDIRYIQSKTARSMSEAIEQGTADFALSFVGDQIQAIDAGAPFTVLAGVQVGAYELFAREGIRHIIQLDGKRIGLRAASSAMLYLMAANVGLPHPKIDITWVNDTLNLFIEGKIDAFLGFPPEPQELHARRVGHVIVNSAVDRPWSRYLCWMLGCSRKYVQKYPVATKRVVRAVLKAADYGVTNPADVARRLVDGGFTPHDDYALQAMNEIPHSEPPDYDAADSTRFYAERMREAGLIKSDPNKIIAENTEWRFLNELKREIGHEGLSGGHPTRE